MRGRSFHATLTATALVLGLTTISHAHGGPVPSGPAAHPTLPADAATGIPATAQAPDPTPTGTLPPAGATPGAGQPTGKAPAEPILSGDDDPEPDVAVKPPIPAPSNDPLEPAPSAPAKPATPAAAKPDATPAKANAAAPVAGAPAQAGIAPAPLAPLNAAIKAALDKRDATEIRGGQAAERRKERAAVAAYYEAHDYAPAWSEDGTPIAAVESVLARLSKAPDDALTIPAPPAKLVTGGTPDEAAASDIALTDTVVAYARQATGSRVDPRAISPLIGARPDLADPAEVVDTIAAAGSGAGDMLAAINPVDPRYAALRDKLAALRGTRAVAVTPIPTGPTLKIGMHDPRVRLLRARFGLLASDLVDDGDEYGLDVAEAVSGFQRSAGLPVSGRLDRRTTAALAGGGKPSLLEAVLEANMEMWRWMPRELGRDRVEVDVPAYTVTVYHDGDEVASNRVVVGKPETPTPLFSNTMKYLIVNPVWNVPDSIIQKEFLPKGSGYMASHGFDVSYRHGKLVVKQPSGEKNALGRIKFMFPNNYSVYLHDTPSKSLFAASRRAFSHGCVRVDQPFDFAFDVLNDSVPEGGKVLWSESRLTGMLGDRERYVYLPKALPIHIEYFTASVDPESGRVVQRDDIYGYAHEVAVALGAEAGPAAVAERKPRHLAERATAKTAIAVDEDPR